MERKHMMYGMIGGAIAAGAIGVGMHLLQQFRVYLPVTITLTTDSSAALNVYGYICSRSGGKKAVLVIPPFAAAAKAPTVSATAQLQLPITLVPVKNSAVKIVKVHSDDGVGTGKLSISQAGVLSLVADKASSQDKPFGLAHIARVEYEVA